MLYLVTDDDGVILAANRAASALLNVRQQFLIGKVLASFVFELDRRGFRTMLSAARTRARGAPTPGGAATQAPPRRAGRGRGFTVSPGTELSGDLRRLNGSGCSATLYRSQASIECRQRPDGR